jgi:hypothetical protein
MDAFEKSSADLEKKLFSERRQQTLFSCGESSSTAALMNEQESGKAESIAPCSETNRRREAAISFDKRMQSLMRSGLIAGITPTSVRRVSGAQIPDFVSSWLDGGDAEKLNQD